MRERDERSAEQAVAPARTPSWPLLRRIAVLLLVLAACLVAMALAAASAGHASVLPVTRDARAHDVSAPSLHRLVGRADLPPRLRPTSPPRALVRTVEDVPDTPDRAPSAVHATAGETPRVLDRTDRGTPPTPVTAAGDVVSPLLDSVSGPVGRSVTASASTLLDPRAIGLGTRGVLQATTLVPTVAVRAEGSVISGAATLIKAVLPPDDADVPVGLTQGYPVTSPPFPASGSSATRDLTVLATAKADQKAPPRSTATSARDARRAAGGPAHPVTRLRGPRTSHGTDHRMPVPYAPMAPVSVTAGSAVSSSSAAGPAIPLLRSADDGPRGHGLRLGTELARKPIRTIARAPGHTPD